MKQHLLIVIDRKETPTITPKKYSLEFEKLSKDIFIKETKKLYEKTYKNWHYETFYFEHSI